MPTDALPPLAVLIAPSGFKEGLGAGEVADQIARGVRRALPQARLMKAPLVDGGEGFVAALVDATGGSLRRVRVAGPLGHPVDADWGLLGGRHRGTAVIEVAAAAGLRLVPRDQRDPTRTTSRGVGQLIRAALDAGARRILLGCGDSAINDAGAGMAQALGAQLLDEHGREIGPGGGSLMQLHRIDLSTLDPRLDDVELDAAVNWCNVLLGERGVTRVYGPQKGATPAQVALLDAALGVFAARARSATGIDIGHAPGSGASGGLGAAFATLLGGRLNPRYDIVMQHLELDRLIEQADLVITAEGCLDAQTPFGKIPSEVARRAKRRGLPVIALAGSVCGGASINLAYGIDAYTSILTRPCTLDEALAEAGPLLARAAEDAVRMLGVGYMLAARQSERRLLQAG